MVIAAGSYPAGRWFESDRRYHIRLLGQAVKTSPFHGGNTGSIPVGVTKRGVSSVGRASALQAGGHRFEPCTPHQIKTVAFSVATEKKARQWSCVFSFLLLLLSHCLFFRYRVHEVEMT